MLAIPAMPPRHPDEMLYGWFMRVAKANGFSNLTGFIQTFLDPDYHPGPDLTGIQILGSLDPSVFGFKSVMDPIRSNTLYPLFSLFMGKEHQASLIHWMCRSNANHCLWDRVSEKRMRDRVCVNLTPFIAVCPDCMKEDRERDGHVWLHQMHHLPGVSRCLKHQSQLMIFRSHKNGLPDENSRLVPVAPGRKLTLEQHMDYTGYVYRLCKAGIAGTDEDLKKALKMKLEERHFQSTNAAYKAFRKERPEPASIERFSKTLAQIYSNRILEVRPAIIFLQWLWPDVDELAETIRDIQKDRPVSDWSSRELETGCEVLEEYAGILSIRHECGSYFLVHEWEWMTNWKCPACQKADFVLEKEKTEPVTDAKFQEILDRAGLEYDLRSKFWGFKNRVRLQAKGKDEAFTCVPIDFLINRKKKGTSGQELYLLRAIVEVLSGDRFTVEDYCTTTSLILKDRQTGYRKDVSIALICQFLSRSRRTALVPKKRKGGKL